MSKGLKVVFVAFTQHCIQSNITHLTHAKRVESVLCIKWPLAPPKYAVRAHNIFTHNFFNIQLIFNLKKVLESRDLDLSNHTIQCYVFRSMLKGSKVKITFDPFDIHSIGWYCSKSLSLSFLKLFWIENQLDIKKVRSKTVKTSLDPFDMSNN